MMNEDFLKSFKNSLHTGYIDQKIASEVLFQPTLLVNNKKPKKKVLTSLLKEFQNCESFLISVAFVTTGGVASIINTLQILRENKIPGKILVSQYLNFTQPEALRRLLQFENIELRIATNVGAHSKGYIFKRKNYYNLIVGSSNLTQNALASNKEWNLQVSAIQGSSIVDKVLTEFEKDFNFGSIVDDKFIDEYQIIYNRQKLFQSREELEESTKFFQIIEPNSMQVEALLNLSKLRRERKNKALIISATGTGKTYLSAFDVKSFNPDKLLFVVHRLNIAKNAMKTFQSIFGPEKSMGLFSGNTKDIESDFVFSTVQTISRHAHLHTFDTTHFDYIIIDESHRSGAQSYLTLLDYFNPKFLLGMTATPERSDGNDIFTLFDHNIAYEIRLNRAMEEEILSPFHYYGVSDLSIDDKKQDDLTIFNKLTSDERVNKVISKAQFYGSDNGLTRGLIFVSKIAEAKELSDKFNLKGFRTIALTGDNSEDERSNAIEKLESDYINEKLDYIFTVDIFNEGIDIPKVNQIIMLRPTSSAIIFVQQLGRGLRKISEKSYLTVIDFIGNYNNNFLIPMALYGDSSYDKDKLRKLISEGSKELPGVSTINFDPISKENIFKAIDSANMSLMAELKNDYKALKNRLGRVPMMMDFLETKAREPFLFVEKEGSYFNFVAKVEGSNTYEIPKKGKLILKYFAKEINNGKRLEESFFLQKLLEYEAINFNEFQNFVFSYAGYKISADTFNSVVNNINLKFIREKKEGALIPVNEILQIETVKSEKGIFSFTEELNSHLTNDIFRNFLEDSISYSMNRFQNNFELEKWNNGFILYNKYSRKDVFRILNYETNPVAQNVGGYLVSPDSRNCPIFVNYHKEDGISESTKYEDKFIDNSTFSWMSKSNRKITSNDVQSILGSHGEISLPLFIKKSNDEGKDFYYMGEITPKHKEVQQTTIKNDSGRNISVVKIVFMMNTPVIDSMYNYLLDISSEVINTNENKIDAFEDTKPASFFKIPLYNFYAAAGSFSELQTSKDYKLIPVDEKYTSENYFACKVIGESMNRRIPNGSICIFKKPVVGSRSGKILLIERFDRQDPDFNSGFTIKTYTSEKTVSDEGWKHERIILKPNSFDKSYEDIVISKEDAEENNFNIIAEFVEILDQNIPNY